MGQLPEGNEMTRNALHYRTKGRARSQHEAAILELACQRETFTTKDAGRFIRRNRGMVFCLLKRMTAQKLIAHTANGVAGKDKPSIWQLRETYERQQLTRHEIAEAH